MGRHPGEAGRWSREGHHPGVPHPHRIGALQVAHLAGDQYLPIVPDRRGHRPDIHRAAGHRLGDGGLASAAQTGRRRGLQRSVRAADRQVDQGGVDLDHLVDPAGQSGGGHHGHPRFGLGAGIGLWSGGAGFGGQPVRCGRGVRRQTLQSRGPHQGGFRCRWCGGGDGASVHQGTQC